MMVSCTIIDQNQKMLPGTDIPTALVALEEIDPIYYDRPYYVTPTDGSAKARPQRT